MSSNHEQSLYFFEEKNDKEKGKRERNIFLGQLSTANAMLGIVHHFTSMAHEFQ